MERKHGHIVARIAVGISLMTAIAVVVWSCAGELDNIQLYRDKLGVLASCFGESQPKFLTATRCTQCHLNKDNGVGAALDLLSADLGTRLTGLIGSCPQEALIDPANPAQSTLYRYVNDEIDGCTYHEMPPSGASVSTADKNCLLTWIDGLDGVDDLNQDDGVDDDDGEETTDEDDTDQDGDDDGDTDEMADEDAEPATLEQIRDEIFDVQCYSCHQAGSPPRGLILGPDLTLADLRDNIVNVQADQSDLDYIEPNDPGASFLLLKVKGEQENAAGCNGTAAPSCGARMPEDQETSLSATDIAKIESWINNGAPAE